MYYRAYALVLRHKQIVKFLVGGGTATVANLATLYVLKGVFDVWYLLASGISFSVGFLLSFAFQKFWTFGKKALDVVHVEIFIALTVALFNLGVNTFLMYTFVQIFHFHYLFAQLCVSALIACETFFVYKYVIFVVKPSMAHKGK